MGNCLYNFDCKRFSKIEKTFEVGYQKRIKCNVLSELSVALVVNCK